jgi:hypothetical protein
MKYLKISSLLVLSLLLFAPAAQAVMECNLNTNLQEIRMESEAEEVKDLTVTCTWGSGDFTDTEAPSGETAATGGTTFNLELDFNGMVAEDTMDDEQMPTLWLRDTEGGATNADDNAALDHVDDDGFRSPAPMGEVSGGSVLWTDVTFPAEWDALDGASTGTNSFTIANLFVDATSVDNDRLKATIVLTDAEGAANIDTEDESDVARVKQALDLELGNEQDAEKFNACEPGGKVISVNIMEGFRRAWRSNAMTNDIMLMTSSGKISVDEDDTPVGALDVTEEGDGDTLIIDVSGAMDSRDDSDELMIKFEPAMGGEGNITLSAMLLPMRRTSESFMTSAELIVGSFDVCKGDGLFFPFVTTMSGWDTGVVVSNDSKVDGSCSLNWGNMDLDDDEMEALSTIDVDSKDFMSFLVSMQRGADYSGSVGVQCTFSGVTGYVFLSDTANNIGQGYLVTP